MIIEKIDIKNYQGHKHSVLELGPGLNVFIGESDAGKSSIVRALRFVLCGTLGAAFIRYGSKKAEVSVTFAGKGTVTRTRTKTSGEYIIGEKKLKATGRGVPPDVADLHGMHEDVNWQGQLDAPFAVSLSGPALAAMLNEIADMSVIDKSVSHAAGRQRAEGMQATSAEQDAQRWTKAEEALVAATETIAPLVESLTKAQTAQKKAKAARKALRAALGALNAATAARTAPLPVSSEQLGHIVAKQEETTAKAATLVRLIGAGLPEGTAELAEVVAKAARRMERVVDTMGVLSAAVEVHEDATDAQNSARTHLAQARKAAPKTCPECGGVL